MTFEFRAHAPSAYSRYAVLLVLLIAVNLILIGIFFREFQSVNGIVVNSIILVVPWLLILLLPSIISGVAIYQSFIKAYRFTLSEDFFVIEQVRKKNSTRKKKSIEWKDLVSTRLVDFEDNHYCNLEFSDRKNNLVIHRESGEFEAFYDALKQHTS
jgi:hypothetical protein